MSIDIDKDEVKVILDLYKKDSINLNQAMNLLGYDGPRFQNNFEGVQWPTIKVKKPVFNPNDLK